MEVQTLDTRPATGATPCGLDVVHFFADLVAEDVGAQAEFLAVRTESPSYQHGPYAGGTFLPYAAEKDPIEGELNTRLEDALVLTPQKKKFDALTIPYDKIIDLEYGQKAGRRVGLAVGLAVVNPVGLATLFSKKRKHYLTVGYTGETGKEQVAVIELGKDIVRTTLAIVETRSGKKIEYQDEEAKKSSSQN